MIKPLGMLLVAAALAAALPAGAQQDRADLDRTRIIGNRELPKVLYIVPWKKPVPGETRPPTQGVLDEVLAPVDRDVFRRQVRYHAQARLESTSPGAGNSPAPADTPPAVK